MKDEQEIGVSKFFGGSFLTFVKDGDRIGTGLHHILTPVFFLLYTWYNEHPHGTGLP